MHIQESGEMYLETIHILLQKNGHVRSIDIAEHMGYSKPSISRAMSLLKKENLIEIDRFGSITLTNSGMAVAKKIYERHILLSQLLISLGVPPEIATEDACKVEHAISDESFEAIKAHVNALQKKPVK